MPMSYSNAMKEAIASVDHGVTFIDTVTISHSTFPAPFRYARADTDLIVNGITYLGKQFKWSLPELKAQSGAGINITVANASRALVDYVRTANNTIEPIKLLFASFIANVPTATASFSTALDVVQISVNKTDLVLNASYPDTINKKVPSKVYTTKEFPGLRN
jgi:hypothetical protein